MTPLRQKMIRTMDLKNLSHHTQRSYLAAVAGLAKHYAALLNEVILYLAVGRIAVEALQRLVSPAPAAGKTVIMVAIIGVIINTLTALMFTAGRQKDLNNHGVFLHMAADAGISLGVVAAGIAMVCTG